MLRTAINPDADPVPQLDSTTIRPTTEINTDALGNIPELPAAERNPFDTPDPSKTDSPMTQPSQKSAVGDVGDHVMSWTQFNSRGNRDPASRLSQPHGAPDDSAAVWGNMSVTKPDNRRNK